MAELRFEPTAAANLEALFREQTKAELADRIEERLDQLESDPDELTGEEFRSRFGLIYAVRVFGSGDDWLILWKRQSDDEVRVYYLGPPGSI